MEARTLKATPGITRRGVLTGMGAAVTALSCAGGWAADTTGAQVDAQATAPNAASAGLMAIGGDLAVNRLGFGAMRITGEGVWGQPKSPAQARALLRRAVELGVNFIDTADAYGPGVSEELIYQALHPYPHGLVIATKGGFTRPSADRWQADGSPGHLRAACEASLQRLHLERIDLYQLHVPDPNVPLEESMGELARLRQEGKIRHIGVSNVDLSQLQRALAVAPVVSVQNRYNVAYRSEDILQFCAIQRLALLPWEPLAGSEPRTASAEGPLQALELIARQRGVSTARVALAWLHAHSGAILPIPGTSSREHLQDNVAAAALRLTPEEMQQLG